MKHKKEICERMKHTKGEWKITTLMAGNKRLKCFWYSIQNVTGATIADVKGRHCGIKNTEAEANTKLIAAAPGLLKLLLDVESVVSKKYSIIKGSNLHCDIKSIIKKATQ